MCYFPQIKIYFGILTDIMTIDLMCTLFEAKLDNYLSTDNYSQSSFLYCHTLNILEILLGGAKKNNNNNKLQ